MTTDPFLKPALKTFGVFSQPAYSSEPYVDPSPYVHREKPNSNLRPMYCSGGQSKSRAANNDGYFEAFKRGFEGEAYTDYLALQRAWQRANDVKRLGKEWVPSSVGKKRCGVGSPYGNFTTVIPAMSTEQVEYTKPAELHNFYTNPGKKGTGYGYPNVALNPLPEWKPGEAMSSELNESSTKELNDKHQELCLGRKVFVSQNASGRLFDPNPYAGGDPLAPGGQAKQVFGVAAFPKDMIIGPTFYPPNPPKRDGGCKAGTINKWPEYTSEPFKELPKILMEQAKNKPIEGNRQWIPLSGTAIEKPTMSIINRSVDLAVNNITRKTKSFVTPFCEK